MNSIILISVLVTVLLSVLQSARAQPGVGPGISIDFRKLDLSKVFSLKNIKHKADTFADCQRKCSGKNKECKRTKCGHQLWKWPCKRLCDIDTAGCRIRCV